MWRGSLLPLGCEAAPKPDVRFASGTVESVNVKRYN